VVAIDPVGTKGKGEAYRKSHTYKRLGLQERDDMIAATRWIAKQCWADKSRISYWGWSYGGFMTSFVAAAGTNLYANLIAVAPVTSWTLYDSIYTERYMLRPQDNPDGYANTSVIAAASTNFDADAWHLFSGTADDNVHWQNSALLVRRGTQMPQPRDTTVHTLKVSAARSADCAFSSCLCVLCCRPALFFFSVVRLTL
jgi:dipeptidyl-peptidase-4